MKKHLVICAAFIAILGSVPPCLADELDDAKAKFMEGMKEIENENYLSALNAFEESYRLYPKDKLLFNIGMCQKALYRYVEGIETLEKFLASGAEVTPAAIEEAEEAVGIMKKLVGRLSLEGAPEGGALTIDGKRIASAPLEKPLLLMPGKHVVVVSKEGFETLETEVVIAADAEVAVKAELTPIEPEPVEPAAQVPPPTPNVEKEKTLPVQSAAAPKKQERSKAMLVTGIVLGAVGLGGIGVGSYFTAQYYGDHDDLAKANENYGETGLDTYKDDFNRLKNDEIPGDIAAMAVCFAVGGALVATGVVLILVDRKKNRDDKPSAMSFAPAAGGMALRF